MGSQVCWGAEERTWRGEWRGYVRDNEEKAEEIKGGGRGREISTVGCAILYTIPLLTQSLCRYGGYSPEMIDGFVHMGFDLDRVVAAFDFVGIDPNGGEAYELEEAYIGDVTARLLGEP